MDTTQEVSRVRRKAMILVYTVSIVVLVQIAVSLIISSNALDGVSSVRQGELERSFNNYLGTVFTKLEGSVFGYAYWSAISEEINRSGRLSPVLAGSWLKNNADQNDYVAILHKGGVILEGGLAKDKVAPFIDEARFMELYDEVAQEYDALIPKDTNEEGEQEEAELKHYRVHYNNMTILLVLAPNADDDGVPLANGVQVFASILDNALEDAGESLTARVSFSEIADAAESFEVPITDELDEESVRKLHIAPNIPLRPLVYLPMFGSLGAQLLITIGIIAVFFVLLGTISKLFGQISALYGEVKKNNERLEAEMRLAGYVQKGILPEEGSYRSKLPVGKLAIKFSPSHQVSGDVYDIVLTEDAEWIIMMDLTGHGLPAALLTTFAIMAFREEVLQCGGPAELFQKMSERLGRYLPEGTFVVAICAKLTSDSVEFCSAGGEDCYFYRKGENKMYALKSSGTMLGISGAETWENSRFELKAGDRMLIFSDGILDIPVMGGGKLGNEMFLNICRKYLALHPQLVVDKVFSDIEGMAVPGLERDDVTMLCVGKEE